ncbi:MAG: hypothetical protein IIY94_06430 [Oscillospiraceae bacterium]|nr:hypothetical protein [Oscillospiraceae bacterium]
MKKIVRKIDIAKTIETLAVGEHVQLSPKECGLTMSSVRISAYRAGKRLGYSVRVFETPTTCTVTREA